MASSILVNVAEDAEHRLVGFFSSPSSPDGFKEVCEASIASGDATKLSRTIIGNQSSIESLVGAPTEEGISAVSLLGALLSKVKDGSSGQLLNELADAIVRVDATASKEVTLLATLYNMRTQPEEKVGLLVRMIRLASLRDPTMLDGNSSALGKWMDPTRLSAMLDEWQVPPDGRRELYRAAADGANTPLAKQQFTLLVVETYSKSDVDRAGLEYAKKAAIGAIQDPVSLFSQQRKMLSLPAIEELGQSDAKLLALLKVFQEGGLKEYHAYLESNGGETVLSTWGMSADKCVRYMRILSLCSLAAEHEEIPYTLVAETLQTPLSDVEKWVVAAVSSGLLSAKMDQLQQQVLVEKSVVRQFDLKEWKALQGRVHLWKKNVGGILDAYKQSLQQTQGENP